jgi:hypothetical protein
MDEEGYFSSAIDLFDRILPYFHAQPYRILAFSALARCVAAVRNHIRFERLASAVLQMVDEGASPVASGLYHLAEGARSFQQWERAGALVERSHAAATAEANETVIRLESQLRAEIVERKAGDIDLVPDEGGTLEEVTLKLLKKLRSQVRPEKDPQAWLFPEDRPRL